jgi:glycosyltransferase involved in cell wall biosynthesis
MLSLKKRSERVVSFHESVQGKEKIKILAVIPGGDDKSSMIFSYRQMKSLKALAIDVDIFILKSRTSLKILLFDIIAFRKKIAIFKPDIIHAQYGTMTSFFCALTNNKPLLITFRGSDLNPISGKNVFLVWIKHLLSQLSTFRARCIICVSQEMKERLWWASDKADVIPTGVDSSIFKPSDMKIARERLGLSLTDKIVIFNVGKSPLSKRLDLAQDAVEFVNVQYQQIYFIKLQGDIKPSEMPYYYNAADCLLLTSDNEGSPTVVQEALSCNCPVVSVEVGDVKDRLAGVWPSKIVKRDSAEIGKGIIEILKIGKRSNGRNFIQNMSLKKQRGQLVSIYRRCLTMPDKF